MNGPVPANNFIGNLGGTNIRDARRHWQTATGKDANSIAANPQFVSATDLHINTSGGATPIENVGSPIVVVTNDVDGDLRNPTTPDIGADEVRCHAVIAGESCNDSNACTVDSCNPATGACGIAAANAGTALPRCGGLLRRRGNVRRDRAAVSRRHAGPGGWPCAARRRGDCATWPRAAPAAARRVRRTLPAVHDSSAVVGGRVRRGGKLHGPSGACPADAFAASTLECRASAGDCDVAESCTGSSAACPVGRARAEHDGVPRVGGCVRRGGELHGRRRRVSGGRARAAHARCAVRRSGDCDVAESCTGDSAACPADAFQPSTVECRASAGACDVAEACTGTSATCPADGFADTSTVCTGVSQGGVCDNDAADHCSGTSDSCLDAFQADTVSCTGTSNGGVCDGNDHCSGTGNVCVDAFLPPTHECRASTATCDPAEFCTGKGGACPADAHGRERPCRPDGEREQGQRAHTATISWTETIPGPFNVYRGSITPSDGLRVQPELLRLRDSGSEHDRHAAAGAPDGCSSTWSPAARRRARVDRRPGQRRSRPAQPPGLPAAAAGLGRGRLRGRARQLPERLQPVAERRGSATAEATSATTARPSRTRTNPTSMTTGSVTPAMRTRTRRSPRFLQSGSPSGAFRAGSRSSPSARVDDGSNRNREPRLAAVRT